MSTTLTAQLLSYTHTHTHILSLPLSLTAIYLSRHTEICSHIVNSHNSPRYTEICLSTVIITLMDAGRRQSHCNSIRYRYTQMSKLTVRATPATHYNLQIQSHTVIRTIQNTVISSPTQSCNTKIQTYSHSSQFQTHSGHSHRHRHITPKDTDTDTPPICRCTVDTFTGTDTC